MEIELKKKKIKDKMSTICDFWWNKLIEID